MIINLGDAPFKAFIKVTYPSGTCTVSLGNKSFTHTGGGTHTFIVNKKGTWTVTATASTGLTRTTTANVTKMGQTVNVGELIYRQYLYNAGNEYGSITGGWSVGRLTTKEATNIYLNPDVYSITTNAITNNSIDVSKYKKLYVYLSDSLVQNGGYSWVKVTVSSATVSTTGYSGAKTITLDISNISSGQVEISASGQFSGAYVVWARVSQVYLDV